MSLFDEDDQSAKAAISYFNELSDQDKALIVSDLNPQTFKLKEHFEALFPLLSRVQNDLSKHDGIKIGNKLLELGLEETYARLIVNNMKRHAPTIPYQLNQLNRIPDDDFTRNIEKILNAIWVDNDKPTAIIEKFDLNYDQYRSILDVTVDMMNRLLRGDINEKQILETFTKNGLSKPKSETYLKGITFHKEIWYSALMFSNIQDMFFRLEYLEDQNKEIIKNMKDILGLLKAQRSKQDGT